MGALGTPRKTSCTPVPGPGAGGTSVRKGDSTHGCMQKTAVGLVGGPGRELSGTRMSSWGQPGELGCCRTWGKHTWRPERGRK